MKGPKEHGRKQKQFDFYAGQILADGDRRIGDGKRQQREKANLTGHLREGRSRVVLARSSSRAWPRGNRGVGGAHLFTPGSPQPAPATI